MLDSKFFEYLRTISKQEYKSFILFAKSPYHNTNPSLAPLLELLQNFHPKLDKKKLTKEFIFGQLHPGDKLYNETRLNYLANQTLNLLQHFLAFETFRNNTLAFHQHQLQSYRDRRLDKAFSKTANQIDHLLNHQREDGESHLAHYQLNKKTYLHPATPRNQSEMPSLENALLCLDRFFAWEKINLAGFAFNRERIFSKKFEIKLLAAVNEEMKSEIEKSTLLNFMSKTTEVLKTPEEKLIVDLAEKMENVIPFFSEENKKNYLTMVLNLSVQKYREGIVDLLPSIFRLYQLGLKHNLFFENNEMKDSVFTSIATSGSAVFNFEWTDQFIKDYQIYLNQNVRENAVSLSYAYFHFEKAIQKNDDQLFNEAFHFIQKMKFSNINYAYRAKTILLRIYYESDIKKNKNISHINDFTFAFEKQLLRKKI